MWFRQPESLAVMLALQATDTNTPDASSPLATPTWTPTPLPTNTPTPLPTNTPIPLPTNTPIPPQTSTPQAPPTNTPIIIVPTDGATMAPGQLLPTPTPFPSPAPPLFPNLTLVATATTTPTSTATPTPTGQPGEIPPEDAGLDLALLIDNLVIASAYVWLCCGLLVLLLAAGGFVFLLQRREGLRGDQAPATPTGQSTSKEQTPRRVAARHKRPGQ